MPPTLFWYATQACVPMAAPWNSPGTGPESVTTLPNVIVSPVMPTSVAPPLSPLNAVVAVLPPRPPSPPTVAAVGSPLLPELEPSPFPASLPLAELPPARLGVPVAAPFPTAAARCSSVTRAPHAASTKSADQSRMTRHRRRVKLMGTRRLEGDLEVLLHEAPHAPEVGEEWHRAPERVQKHELDPEISGTRRAVGLPEDVRQEVDGGEHDLD